MSDESTPTVELTEEPVAAKGGLIKGDDGKLSGRKIIGLPFEKELANAGLL
jgi:hypothetical protein